MFAILDSQHAEKIKKAVLYQNGLVTWVNGQGEIVKFISLGVASREHKNAEVNLIFSRVQPIHQFGWQYTIEKVNGTETDTVGREAVTASSAALFRWPEVHQTHFADIEQKWWGFWIEYSVSIERRIRRSIAFCAQ